MADRGWLEEALREFGRAIDLDKNAPFPRINRASVYLEQGRMLEALEDLLVAVQLAPDDPNTHYHLGLFLARYGAELGLRELQTCLAQDPEQIDALLQLSVTHAERGEFREAEDALEAALEIDPHDPLANREKGVLLMDQGKVHEAIRYLRDAQEHNPADQELMVDLGLAYIQAGFLDQAEQALLSVLERDPDHLYAVYNLAAICAEKNLADQALEWIERAAAIDRNRVLDWLRDDPLFSKIRHDERFSHFEADEPQDVE